MGYRQTKPRARPTMEPFLLIIFEVLEADRKVPWQQGRKEVFTDANCSLARGKSLSVDQLLLAIVDRQRACRRTGSFGSGDDADRARLKEFF